MQLRHFAMAAGMLLAGGCAVNTTESPDVSNPAGATPAQAEAQSVDAGDDSGNIAATLVESEPLASAVAEPVTAEPVTAAPEAEAETTPVPASVAPDKGDVIWIQKRLKDLGYYSGPIDGDAGGATRRAIREYQTDQGLTATGRPTADLQDFMWRNGG